MVSVCGGIRSTAAYLVGNGVEGHVVIGMWGGVLIPAMPGPTRRNSAKGCWWVEYDMMGRGGRKSKAKLVL